MKTIKCLSVRQPWAWLIVAGHKTLENRTWNTAHRGQLLIHASARPDPDANFLASATHHETGIKFPPTMPLGSIVGMVNVSGVITISKDYWFDGPYAFKLTDPQLFDRPVPYRGQLGLYNVSWPQPATKQSTQIKQYTPKIMTYTAFMRELNRRLR